MKPASKPMLRQQLSIADALIQELAAALKFQTDPYKAPEVRYAAYPAHRALVEQARAYREMRADAQ